MNPYGDTMDQLSDTRERLDAAREDYAQACQACVRGEPDAEAQMKMALDEIGLALRDIEALEQQRKWIEELHQF